MCIRDRSTAGPPRLRTTTTTPIRATRARSAGTTRRSCGARRRRSAARSAAATASRTRARSCATTAPAATSPARSHTDALLRGDDRVVHRRERADQLLLLLGGHLEVIERRLEVLDERIEVGVLDVHPHVRRLHVLAGVGARTAGRLADLVGQ